MVGMSGGVDSSVAAALLKEQGYEPVGITITPFKISPDCRTKEHEKSCCSYKSVLDANHVCEKLGIEHVLVDLTDDFRINVVDNFIKEYLSGRTPNPCVVCNPIIKWNGMIKKAAQLDCQFIATGHYARVRKDKESERWILMKGQHSSKDQAYFLWRLNQEQLSRTLFPLGELDKATTRELARKYNLPVFNKPESQEICFIPDNDYSNFLLKNSVEAAQIGKGEVILDGKVIGTHKGYFLYTIGQRKGLGIAYKTPLFVKNIIPETNQVLVAPEEELLCKGLIADNINIIKTFSRGIYTVKIRFKDTGSKAYCHLRDDNTIEVQFIGSKKAIAPGQSCVIYDEDDVIAGGEIRSTMIL